VTWKFPFLLISFPPVSWEKVNLEGVGNALRVGNYVSLGIISLTDIHKYLFMYKQELSPRGITEGATGKNILSCSRDFDEAFLEGAKTIMTFHIFTPTLPLTPRAKHFSK
jgi:hypothetical protein